jgi:UDP-N-acetylglucosamine 2-epimerase (non-hydrolysing)
MGTRIHCIVGARPNFVKIGPIWRALARHARIETRLIHTGQHYDSRMSRAFFEDLAIPEPDRHLEVGSGSHAAQTARIMERYEPVLLEERPALVLVVGDVNSTLAASLVASKLGVAVAHVEAGLRSFDRTMPEEINRILTDAIADHLFITCRDAAENLRAEGIAPERIHFVGNVMIDALLESLPLAAQRDAPARFGLAGKPYAVATIHRPSNVDERAGLERVIAILHGVAAMLPVVFPVHPRTEARAEELGMAGALRGVPGLTVTPPLRYLEFQDLLRQAHLVLTDSGGIQEETTVLGIPCLTLRPNTERPITVTQGTNRVVGTDPATVVAAAREAFERPRPEATPRIELWDGHAAERIAAILDGILAG